MLNILLIRAGATEYTSQGRVQGTLDVPLSEDGRKQVEQAAEQLSNQSIEALYCGPCRATLQTAEIIGKGLDLKPKTNVKLRNLDHGLWQGMLIEDVKVKQPKVYRQWQEHPETVCPPDGETLQSAREKKHKSGTVALVLIDPLARVCCNLLREDDLGDMWQANGHGERIWDTFSVGAEPVRG